MNNVLLSDSYTEWNNNTKRLLLRVNLNVLIIYILQKDNHVDKKKDVYLSYILYNLYFK